jgi:ArsR family transcriptional regulator
MIKKARKTIPMEVLERTATALRVLGHPHRLKIVELLGQRRLTVGQLARAIGIAPNACSQHLNLMRAHGLLSCSRNGKAVYYQVDNPSAMNVIRCIRRYELGNK